MTSSRFAAPSAAPKRPDLAFLTHRTRRVPTAAPQAPARPQASAIPQAPARPQVAAPRPVTAPRPTPAASSSLDLSTPAPPPTARPAPPAQKTERLRLPTRRLDRRLVLDPAKTPVVRLNRLQAGVGALTIEARCPTQVGPLLLGCVWRFQDRSTGTVNRDPSSGVPVLALAGNRPVLSAHNGTHDTITIDLRQVRSIDTLLLYAFATPPSVCSWAGTLSLSTLAGAQIVVPMDAAPSAGYLPLASIRQVDGHLYVRAQRRWPLATLKDVCTEFGFAAAMTWLDPNTPA